MRESVLDVLMYLFEAYIETQDIPEINHDDLKTDLVKAGFSISEIEKAFDWLDKLADNNEIVGDLHDNASSRVYNDIEMNRLLHPHPFRYHRCYEYRSHPLHVSYSFSTLV